MFEHRYVAGTSLRFFGHANGERRSTLRCCTKGSEITFPEEERFKLWLLTCMLAIWVAVSSLGLAGCSKQQMADVAGQVVYAKDGTAAIDMVDYRVSFFCDRSDVDGKDKPRISATGEVRKDGTFVMNTYEMGDGVLLGTHSISVTPPLLLDETVLTRTPIIDPRFSNPRTSGLTAVVDSDTEVVLEVERVR